ncbi:MAG: thiamine diphosphokinase [Candidatus Izemoplasmatales bacterium]
MSRKIKIFAGPNTYRFQDVYFEEADEFLVGVDSGCQYLIDANIRMQLAVGDFDSLNPKYRQRVDEMADQVLNLPFRKDMTDLAYALDWIYNNMTYDQIEVYGGLGGRIDHLLANLNLLKRYEVTFRDSTHKVFLLRKGKHRIENLHRYISFFATEDVYDLQLHGFSYELDDYFLSTTDSVCVSNQGSGVVEFSKGKLMVVCSNENSAISSHIEHD